MPPTRRTATLGTANSITEDLRFMREAGGVGAVPDSALAGTLHALGYRTTPIDDDQRRLARTLILTHTRRTCQAITDDRTADPCRKAAAESIRTILSGLDSRRTAGSVRRAAKAMTKCTLTIDGIRKREDSILRMIAVRTFEDIKSAQDGNGPQTIEEYARYVYPQFKASLEVLEDSLRWLYQKSPDTERSFRNQMVKQSLYHVAILQYWAGRMVSVRNRGNHLTKVDLWFLDVANVIMARALNTYDDRVAVNRLVTAVGPKSEAAFLSALATHPHGLAILDHWRQWITSCHPECAYQRSFRQSLLCQPHELVWALYIFVDSFDDLLSGQLEKDLNEDWLPTFED